MRSSELPYYAWSVTQDGVLVASFKANQVGNRGGPPAGPAWRRRRRRRGERPRRRAGAFHYLRQGRDGRVVRALRRRQ
eukprot:2352494-Pyramimonas_sp.AAC.1